MTKRFEITYKNINICFGDNTFTKVLEGRTAEDALRSYGFENNFILRMVEAKEVK